MAESEKASFGGVGPIVRLLFFHRKRLRKGNGHFEAAKRFPKTWLHLCRESHLTENFVKTTGKKPATFIGLFI